MRCLLQVPEHIVLNAIKEALLQIEQHASGLTEEEIYYKYHNDPQWHRYVQAAARWIYSVLDGSAPREELGPNAQRLLREIEALSLPYVDE